MKIFYVVICSIFFTAFFPPEMSAQSRRKKPKQLFGTGLILGLNATQVDGDHAAGYHKKGMYGGLRGVVNFSYRTRMHIELVYSQKGSRWALQTENRGPVIRGKMKSDYVEIPFLVHSFFSGNGEGLFWEAGFSFARRVNLKIEDKTRDVATGFSFNDLSDEFRSNELNLVFGGGYQWPSRVAAGIRWTTGLTNVYDASEENLRDKSKFLTRKPISHLRNYYLTFLVSYGF